MCRGYRQKYHKCGHLRLPIHYDECSVAMRSGVRCKELVISGELQTIPAPRVCVDCYRQREAEIFAFYDGERQAKTDQIDHAQQALLMNSNMDVDTRIALKRQVGTMRAAIFEYSEACSRAIARFRQEQGVWGDDD